MPVGRGGQQDFIKKWNLIEYHFREGQKGERKLLVENKPENIHELYDLAQRLNNGYGKSCYIEDLADETNKDKIRIEEYKLAILMMEDIQIQASQNEDQNVVNMIEDAREQVKIIKIKLDKLQRCINAIDEFKLSLEMKENNPLEDFPQSEVWRLVTDGWQQGKGITDFTKEYYGGMSAAFDVLKPYVYEKKPITVDLIELVHDKASQFAPEFGIKKGYQGFRADNDHIKFGLFSNASKPQDIGVTQDGLNELVDAENLAADQNRWRLTDLDVTSLSGSNKFIESLGQEKTYDKEKRKQELTDIIKSDSEKKLTLFALEMPEENVKARINSDIDEFYLNMEKLNGVKEDGEIRPKKIGEIIKFIRKLNQNHWFFDGNGRMCVMLLQLLLIQNFNSMAIINTPAHLTGFSTKELIDEIQDGMNEFNKYKITKAKNFLLNLPEKIDQQKLDKIKLAGELEAQLASEAHIAMAQINELFLQIKRNQILIKDQEMKPLILEVLKNLYLKKLNDFAENHPRNDTQQFKDEAAFKKMIQHHEINQQIDVKELDRLQIVYFRPFNLAQRRKMP